MSADQYDMNRYEYVKFQEHIQTRLPNYRKYFEKYAEKYDIPWTLVAAVAYQESKWDETAVSHTGVRGLMQLTEQTAEHLGVHDRENPLQSIQGGTHYLKYLFDKTVVLAHGLSETQRWIQALCAYNLGWGHLKDMHRVAARLKRNAYDWDDLRVVLPKLRDEKFTPVLRYGFARGNETVDFVENVFIYYRLLNDTFLEDQSLAGL